ncbi:MAG: XisH family protein [Saprospiraceae bacterium]
MPRRDLYHYQVREALEKDGWVITSDPLDLSTGGVELYADLGTDRVLAAERGEEKIAVEIKSFSEGQSPVSEFHKASGQFDSYKFVLEEKEPDREVFLAIPLYVWEDFFQRPLIQRIVHEKPLRIIVVDISTKTIALWIR